MGYAAFLERVGQVNDLIVAKQILAWDARTMMPPGGAETRAKQEATLMVMARDLLVSDDTRRLLVDFEPDVLDRMTIGDTVQIRATGRGLRLNGHPSLEFKKTSPALAEAFGLRVDGGRVICPVAMELPARIMGSGAELNAEFVDQDLMSGDRALMAELGIDQMRLGDLIAIRDVDHRFGRSYRRGWVAICLCIHGDSVLTGHGPGILTLITGPEDALGFTIDPAANIATTLAIRKPS